MISWKNHGPLRIFVLKFITNKLNDMKNEAVKIVGLVVFFFVMGVMVGYNMRASQEGAAFVDTEIVVKSEREAL